MDQHHHNSSWQYDTSAPPPYHDGGPFNHGGGFSNGGHYNHHRRYQNNFQDAANEPTDSFGYANGAAFSGRKRQFSHGPPELSDGYKLYVSGVPREVTEEDIRSLFGKYGTIAEVVLFKTLKTVQQQEGCFVKYAKMEDALQAIKALHNQYTFPGRMRPIEVKYATRQERPGFLKTHENKVLRGPENKVFVCFLNRHASREEIVEVFSPYGCVEDVYLMLDDQRRSRGMGFITFSNKAMATDAISGLSGKYTMEGCDQPLVVRFADPKKPRSWENRYPQYSSDPAAQTSLPNSSQMSSVSSSPVPAFLEMEDPPDCEWSEHVCPDGNAYYYNCVTCESLWEKPEEYRLYEQQNEKDSQQSNHPTWVS